MIKLAAPAGPLEGHLSIRGSKSISNRVLILNHLPGGSPRINNISDAEDTRLLADALAVILPGNTATINVQHAGTNMRFLTALLSATSGDWLLTGSARMKQRPIAGLVNALRDLGADIRYTETEGCPPLHIKGRVLQGGSVAVEAGTSSQFISAMLLIAPALEKGIAIRLKGEPVSQPYIRMTLEILKMYGITSDHTADTIRVPAQTARPPLQVDIESDWSSASYWFSCCALSKGSALELSAFEKNSLQADAVLPELYRNLGVDTVYETGKIMLRSGGRICAKLEHDFTHCPDIAMTVAVTCFGLGIPARLTGLQTLKLKESDRISALGTELRKAGARVESGPDWLEIGGKPDPLLLSKHSIACYHDHRMAMSFAPLCLAVPQLSIADPDVVIKSYPRFWEDLKSLGFSVTSPPD